MHPQQAVIKVEQKKRAKIKLRESGLFLHTVPSRLKNGTRHLPQHQHIRYKIDGESNAQYWEAGTLDQIISPCAI